MHGKIRATMNATSHRQVETDRAIVTEWRFAPGAETGHHVHAHDYIVVPLTTGTLRLEEPEGVRINVEAAWRRGIARVGRRLLR